MATVHMTEAEVASILRAPERGGRPIMEILREAKLRNSTATLDPDFSTGLEAIIASHQQPWNPPLWESPLYRPLT